MMVEYQVRALGSCDYKIEKEKCSVVDSSMRSAIGGLSAYVQCPCGNSHYQLKQNCHVFVNLTFFPEKTTGESTDRLDLKRLRESQTLSDCKLVCAGVSRASRHLGCPVVRFCRHVSERHVGEVVRSLQDRRHRCGSSGSDYSLRLYACALQNHKFNGVVACSGQVRHGRSACGMCASDGQLYHGG
ncbi:uncharacterized protein LOC129597207 [Paramacrobiotus metropolitanus]|uniref:uncharacterized protein LOC129597207 n=1 Tax=Paramacrobiotus metropolitanus TaxID=2943436 RepID=UPI00244575A8|nr:uncharacterized protein LOC129597207 [Paramacrobiotus metropolitanus]